MKTKTIFSQALFVIAFCFTLNNTNAQGWAQKGIDMDGEAANDYSGYSVSMPDANTIAIGAYLNDGTGSNAGHVRVYRWNGTAWAQKGIDINGEAASDQSGYSVSMPDSNTIAIGAPNNDGTGSNAGHVRIYAWNGTAWVQKGIDIDGEAASDYSGATVSMPDANTIAIGARYNNGNGADAGHARIYKWNGTAWQQKGADINGETAGDESGCSVSMPDSNAIAIGALYNSANFTYAGHTRIYTWNGNSWQQRGQDIDGEAPVDYSGSSVSMPDTNTFATGAYLNDQTGADAGHARVFKTCYHTVSVITVSDCYSYTSPSGNYTYTTSGIYMDTIANTTGCDSIITINLSINSNASTISPTACNSYLSPAGNTYTTSGQYTETITNTAGCDSVITINLTINTVDASVTVNGNILTANASNAIYQWVDCGNNFAIINGATNQSYTATANGNYAVIVTENNCTDTSACELIIGVGFSTISNLLSQVYLYPNPTTGNITINIGAIYSNLIVTVRNVMGQELQTKTYDNAQLINFTMDGDAGVYFVELKTNDKTAIIRVVKN
jgi:hypothetical protein